MTTRIDSVRRFYDPLSRGDIPSFSCSLIRTWNGPRPCYNGNFGTEPQAGLTGQTSPGDRSI
jgi:hypothetical protein